MEAPPAPHMGTIPLQDLEEEEFVVGQLLEQAAPQTPLEAENAFGLWTPPQTPKAGAQPVPMEEFLPAQNVRFPHDSPRTLAYGDFCLDQITVFQENPLFLYEVDGEDEGWLMHNGLVDNGPDDVDDAGAEFFGAGIWHPNGLLRADEEMWLDTLGIANGQMYPYEEQVDCERADCTFCRRTPLGI